MTRERADSPRLKVNFLGREYSGASGAETFEVTSTLTNMYDGWSLDLPIGPQGINEDIPDLNLHRWVPITLQHSDPAVEGGAAIPLMMGVCTNVVHEMSSNASVLRLSGFDLGKLFDSCAPPWIRLRGIDFQTLINKIVDPSWLRNPGPVTSSNSLWGIQGVGGLRDVTLKLGVKPQSIGLNLGTRLSQGRADAVRQSGQQQALAQMPPIMTEVGETVFDVISRYARLTGVTQSSGSFVSCSADGYIQIFNPNDYANNDPLYVFNYTNDERNIRIKKCRITYSGDDLYTEYDIYGSIVLPPSQARVNINPILNPVFGRFYGQSTNIGYLGDSNNRIARRSTQSDPEQYQKAFAQARSVWRKKQSLYKELSIQLTVQGHSMPGPDGKWRPIVEGNIAEFNSPRLNGKFMIEQVTKRQNISGTECDVVLRIPGLLGA